MPQGGPSDLDALAGAQASPAEPEAGPVVPDSRVGELTARTEASTEALDEPNPRHRR